MKGGVGLYFVGTAVLLALAGCGRSFFSGEREPWRRQAEVECLRSGAVKPGAGLVRMEPIEGPGMCGADFPLKVATLGESSPIVGYADDPRPPGSIPNAGTQMPPWPASEPRYAPPAVVAPPPVQSIPASPPDQSRMRWVPGPPPASYDSGRPMTLNPPDVTPSAAPLPDDIPDDATLPPSRAAAPYPAQRTSNAPVYQPQQRVAPSLGRSPGTQFANPGPAALTPAATLACPIVSALDRWVSEGVQPAAQRWFGAPVVEIKQISAYSCRTMVGAGTSHISEHAFGNAIDIAAFTLSDGRRITVQEGWHGTPEEQGFLHDVQLAACENFTTVLAPGYNAAHYNHIHVDLMRRSSGDRPCRPEAIPGNVAAAKARAAYASHHYRPGYTGSINKAGNSNHVPEAVPGQDGYILDLNDVTGSLPAVLDGGTAPSETRMPRPNSNRADRTADPLTAH